MDAWRAGWTHEQDGHEHPWMPAEMDSERMDGGLGTWVMDDGGYLSVGRWEVSIIERRFSAICDCSMVDGDVEGKEQWVELDRETGDSLEVEVQEVVMDWLEEKR